ncbi:hemophore-related protein, Rv0203/Rv1174c family [Mycolicibacterium rutilum]|uniref:Hemophore-related protein, Rv0203/Rv1174c family n=1 Tax=Mycolicibacterium rutilum TaxID=370526 RepID=A0A1H6LM71_MYCRU|nr:heme-binding protein [Mycolicibacterium rutilum]SEH85974.1 hemophore-related protein, Rv0203/Rv1174c family [Mycolicibacterium rutilum]
MRTTMRSAVLGAVAVGAWVVVAAPTATAAPCTASGLATTASGVLAEAGGYLEAHPGANDVLTAAATQPADQARNNVRAYFTAHPGEYLDLRRIAGPLSDMRNQCGISVSPVQLATLLETMGS